MKIVYRKGLSILLALCMMLTPMPGMIPHVKAFDIVERTTALDLTLDSISYMGIEGPGSANPQNSDITDTAEGWSWNHSAKTLVLDGIDLETSEAFALTLPAGSTIALADGSINTVKSTYSDGSATCGIKSPGNLTIQGSTGRLSVESGSFTNSSSAIYAQGNLAISGGIINAKGGQASGYSIGLSATTVNITGGNITTSGGTDVPGGSTFGVYCSLGVHVSAGTLRTEGRAANQGSYGIFNMGGNITFSGGTVFASAHAGAATSFAVTGTIVDDGMTVQQKDSQSNYTLAATKSDYYYVYNTDTPATDIMITPQLPGATVSNKTVSGIMGTPLSGTDTLTITLKGYSFIELADGDDVSDWFSNLPVGLAVTVSSFDQSTAVLAFSGTPTELYSGVMSITIPGDNLTSSSDLVVTENINARFDILSVFPRTTMLDLTAVTNISYAKADGTIGSENPSTSNITDTAEGWSWDYSTKTLMLDGINLITAEAMAIMLPPNSTIVLADGSNNTVYSLFNGSMTSRGISCDGVNASLTIKGSTGRLSVTSGISSISNSVAFLTTGSLTIWGGIIDATARSAYYNSMGMQSGGPLIIHGGTVTATGGDAENQSFGMGIFGSSSFSINGGTVTAVGGNGAKGSMGIFSSTAIFSNGTTYAKSAPVSKSYAICSTSSITDTDMAVLQKNASGYAEATTKTHNTDGWYYTFGTNNTPTADIMIKTAIGATVSNKTISSMTNTALSSPNTITVTLTGCTFSEQFSIGDVVSGWFSNLPQGLEVTVSSVDTNIALLAFSGIPTEASDEVMSITIPGSNLSTGDNLPVAFNDSARFDIFQAPSFSGTGTEQAPYLISSAAQLKEMSDYVNNRNHLFGDSHYKLTNNIILNEDIENNPEQWSPIGTSYSTSFTGVFDGNSRSISGLYMDGDGEYSGLFGYINGGIVKNLGLTGGFISSSEDFSYAGSIVGFIYNGTIEDCYNTGTVKGKFVGGIAGTNIRGHIQDCYNAGDIYGLGNFPVAGGIVGDNRDADMTIVNCYNTGSVTASVSGYSLAYVGGIAGQNTDSTIKNCYSTGSLTGNTEFSANAYVGGIAGGSESGTIENAYWLESTAEYGIAESSDNTGCTAMANTDMKAAAFIQALNNNADALKTSYATISSWKADTNNENSGYPVFGEAAANFTLTIANGGTGATAGGSYTADTAVPVNAGTKTGYTFNGWTTSGGGSFTNAGSASTVFTMPSANVTITANWRAIPSNDDDSSSSSGSSGNPGEASTTDIIVNGQSTPTGNTKTDTGSDGRTVTTVTIDSDKLKAILAKESTGTKVIIPVTSGADAAVGKLTGEMVRSMEDKSATLIIQTGSSSYTLPAAEINIDAVSQKLGTNVSLADITVSVSISEPSDNMIKTVESSGKNGGFTVVTPAVDFTITCTYGEKTVNVSSFNAYVERTIAIPSGVDPSKITTGIVVKADGTVYHVPTRVIVIDGKYYAVINSLTNSTYSVIWNPMEFSDVTNHWAKDAINNMGSRMVITGVGNNNYNPSAEITRAEFAAIIVRALGLEPGTGASSFRDVDSSKWYSGYIQTAVSYGIIKGYDAETFGPNDTITREQAITMIARAIKITGLNADLADSEVSKLIGAYKDGAAVSSFASSSIAACLKTDIVSGKEGNVLDPKTNITRAEAAVMIERLLKKSNLIQ